MGSRWERHGRFQNEAVKRIDSCWARRRGAAQHRYEEKRVGDDPEAVLYGARTADSPSGKPIAGPVMLPDFRITIL